MKRTLLNTLLASFLCVGSTQAITVHDPAQTAATVAKLQKQLEEWGVQHKDMALLNDLNKQISEYSKKLNDYIGDAKQAAQKINQAKSVIDRLKNFDRITDVQTMRQEIEALKDLTSVLDLINKDSSIYGEITEEVNGVKVERDASKYRRHAVITQRAKAYEEERNLVVDEISNLQNELATASQEAQNAKTQTEQLAVLIKIEIISSRLGVLQNRFAVRLGDLSAQASANEDRKAMEEQAKVEERRQRTKYETKRMSETFKGLSRKATEAEKRKFNRDLP